MVHRQEGGQCIGELVNWPGEKHSVLSELSVAMRQLCKTNPIPGAHSRLLVFIRG